MSLPLKMDYVPGKIAIKAERELGETAERKKASIEKLKKLVEKEKDILTSFTDEELLIYLRFKKFDVDKALISLQKCRNINDILKSVDGKLSLDIGIKVCQGGLLTLLPFRDDEGCVLVLYRICNYDTKTLQYVDFFSASTLMVLASLHFHPVTQISGIKIIADCRGLTLNHALHIRLKVLQNMSTTATNVFPARFKSMFLLSDSIIIPNIWRLVKPFLSKKLQERVYVSGSDISSLLLHFKAEILPVELGGTLIQNNEIVCEIMKTFWNTDIVKYYCNFK